MEKGEAASTSRVKPPQIIKNGGGVHEVAVVPEFEVEDARTRSSTGQQNQKMTNNLQAQVLKHEMIQQPRNLQKQHLIKIKRKIICALASIDKNENVDLWLTMGDKLISKVLKHNMTLNAIFSKQIKKVTESSSDTTITPSK